MNATDIVGFTHSDGYVLCTDCEDGSTVDENNESGYVFPIFASDEWDYPGPSCDICLEKIDVVLLDVLEDEE